MLVVTIGWFVLMWAVLILVSNTLSEPPSPWLPRIAAALVFVGYGATLIKRDRRAVPFTWIIVALLGAGVLLGGLVPIQILFWTALAAFAYHLQRNRARLFVGSDGVGDSIS